MYLQREHLKTLCASSLNIIRNEINKIKQNFAIIAHQLESKRVKRGIINGIGNALKWLIGTPDADDADFYTDSIQSLKRSTRNSDTHETTNKRNFFDNNKF